jgi:hypothetical protein
MSDLYRPLQCFSPWWTRCLPGYLRTFLQQWFLTPRRWTISQCQLSVATDSGGMVAVRCRGSRSLHYDHSISASPTRCMLLVVVPLTRVAFFTDLGVACALTSLPPIVSQCMIATCQVTAFFRVSIRSTRGSVTYHRPCTLSSISIPIRAPQEWSVLRD